MVVEFQLFDVWLFEHGLDARSLSELPSFSELCGDSPVPGILPAFLKAEQSNVKNGKKDPTPPAYFSEETAVQVDETLPCFTTSVGCRSSLDWRLGQEMSTARDGEGSEEGGTYEAKVGDLQSPKRRKQTANAVL